MKAVEVTGVVDEQGNLSLDTPIPDNPHGAVRVIILYAESRQGTEQNPDDTSVEDVKASLRRALAQGASGQRLPLSQMWDGIDNEPAG
jgi:N-acyl-D-aspartate/D-glutamate deacylase